MYPGRVQFSLNVVRLKSYVRIHLQLKLWTAASAFLVSFQIQLGKAHSMHAPVQRGEAVDQ